MLLSKYLCLSELFIKLNLPNYLKKSVETKVNDKIQAWFYIFYSLMPILCCFVSPQTDSIS